MECRVGAVSADHRRCPRAVALADHPAIRTADRGARLLRYVADGCGCGAGWPPLRHPGPSWADDRCLPLCCLAVPRERIEPRTAFAALRSDRRDGMYYAGKW